MNYFISDLHFNHENAISLNNRPFASVNEMNETMINNWNGVVKNCDTVYIVGDFTWKTKEAQDILKLLKGKKILITGNHDGGLVQNEEAVKYFEMITPYLQTHIDSRTITLCHYPMLEWKNRRKVDSNKLGYLIYGHIHNNLKPEYAHLLSLPNALNAGADINNFTPVTFDQLAKNNANFYSIFRNPIPKP